MASAVQSQANVYCINVRYTHQGAAFPAYVFYKYNPHSRIYMNSSMLFTFGQASRIFFFLTFSSRFVPSKSSLNMCVQIPTTDQGLEQVW